MCPFGSLFEHFNPCTERYGGNHIAAAGIGRRLSQFRIDYGIHIPRVGLTVGGTIYKYVCQQCKNQNRNNGDTAPRFHGSFSPGFRFGRLFHGCRCRCESGCRSRYRAYGSGLGNSHGPGTCRIRIFGQYIFLGEQPCCTLRGQSLRTVHNGISGVDRHIGIHVGKRRGRRRWWRHCHCRRLPYVRHVLPARRHNYPMPYNGFPIDFIIGQRRRRSAVGAIFTTLGKHGATLIA